MARRTSCMTGALDSWKRWIIADASASRRASGQARGGASAKVLADLETGREVLAAGEQRHELDVPLVLERVQGRDELPHHLDREHVRRRSVERDPHDPLGGSEMDVLVGRLLRGGVGLEILQVFEVLRHARRALSALAGASLLRGKPLR